MAKIELTTTSVLKDLTNMNESINNDSVHETHDVDSSSNNRSDDEVPIIKRKRLKQFSNSESEGDNENVRHTDSRIRHVNSSDGSDNKNSSDENKDRQLKIKPKKSRIKTIASSDSDTDSDSKANVESRSRKKDSARIKNKKNKLKNKFKNLLSPRGKQVNAGINEKSISGDISDKSSDSDNTDVLSNSSTKQQELDVEEKIFKPIMTLCDPDTSDEESNTKPKYEKKVKSTKPTSQKPLRMSAKQAMENMQKIKSESNRMLREKEVSLPYHRPKALSLKDIMNRRKLAVTSDGKALPIKMNSEQLAQYALLLEQRQKEMMELCKSDSEEEDVINTEKTEDTQNMDVHADSAETNEGEALSESKANDKEVDGTNNLVPNSREAGNNVENIELIPSVINVNVVNELEDKNILNSNLDNVMQLKDFPNSNVENDISHKGKDQVKNISHNNDEIVQDKDAPNQSMAMDVVENTFENKPEQKDESQMISLHYTEDTDINIDNSENADKQGIVCLEGKSMENIDETNLIQTNQNLELEKSLESDFADDFNMEDIDNIIENAEILSDTTKEKAGSLADLLYNIKPKLTGCPGMLINLDTNSVENKLSGVELLKERFTYFAKLKSLEDKEKNREKKYKPGTQHLMLKQELEEQIAEQRSIEWAKRLEAEKKLKKEMEGDGIDDIEKMEEKLAESYEETLLDKDESSEEEEEPEEDDMPYVKENPRKKNPMIDDEAEVSDDEDDVDKNEEIDEVNNANEANAEDNDENYEESSDDSSDSDEEEKVTVPKKGRILKAFEDSDDEEPGQEPVVNNLAISEIKNRTNPNDEKLTKSTQDEELPLAQLHKSFSEDLFSSQDSGLVKQDKINELNTDNGVEADLGSQTFSILDSTSTKKMDNDTDLYAPDKLSVICETQPYDEANFDAIAGMCSGSFSQNLVTSQTQSQSQVDLGDDVIALCTGKFYDNPFLSQNPNEVDKTPEVEPSPTEPVQTEKEKEINKENTLLKSILEELDDPYVDEPKQNKYFFSSKVENTEVKKKFVIDSEDEMNDESAATEGQKKKHKKRKLEDRALQISDDEDEESEEGGYEDASDIEDDDKEERIVEYDSEENEVEVPKVVKKNRNARDFFEQEAELSSEDEWIGSGDEDEAGLDRMEREEGDDETFNQGQLQRKLGQIHMREVLDQDKREVRLLQELLFEDGDLGDGHRQRKFRWQNADDEEEKGTVPDDLDTQEEEFESEEQWRKQRHERQVFLRQIQEKDNTDDFSSSINCDPIIKASLSSTMSTMKSMHDKPEVTLAAEKKSVKDIPSPKKAFTIFQQNYHSSLLTRGRGSLSRLAALVTPLVADDEAPKNLASNAKRNFVFAAITPEEAEPKVNKRKADESTVNTPRLLKKMKMDEKKQPKLSLFDRLDV